MRYSIVDFVYAADKYHHQQQKENGSQKEEEVDDDDKSGSLQSTSSFLPVLNNSFEDHPVAPPTTFSSLASSLSHAYGYPQNSDGVLLLTDLLLSEKEEEEEEVTRPVTLSERDGETS